MISIVGPGRCQLAAARTDFLTEHVGCATVDIDDSTSHRWVSSRVSAFLYQCPVCNWFQDQLEDESDPTLEVESWRLLVKHLVQHHVPESESKLDLDARDVMARHP